MIRPLTHIAGWFRLTIAGAIRLTVRASVLALMVPFAYAELPPERAVIDAFVAADVATLKGNSADLSAACVAQKSAWICYRAAHASYLVAVATLTDAPADAAKALGECGAASARIGADSALKAEADALLSGCYGLSIAMNPAKGMSLGPASATLLETALKAAPNSPRVHYFAATRLFRTPAQWGGDKKAALEHVKTGQALIAKQSASAESPNWGKAELAALRKQIEAAN
jgi:hypothetical protein